MEKLKAVIARLDERAKSPMMAISGMGSDLQLVRAALVEVDQQITLQWDSLCTLSDALKTWQQQYRDMRTELHMDHDALRSRCLRAVNFIDRGLDGAHVIREDAVEYARENGLEKPEVKSNGK